MLDRRRRASNNRARMVISCRHEKSLGAIAVFFAALFWAGLALLLFTLLSRQFSGLSPTCLLGLMTAGVIVTQAALWLRRSGQVAWLRGRAVQIGPRQFPEMHAHLRSACQRLGVEPPVAYVFQRSRFGDIFQLRHARKPVIAFSAGLIDAASDHPGTFEFFVGHALGRGIKSRRAALLFPATVLPLLGPAWNRLRIHCADRYGLAACKNPGDAVLALMLLAHRGRRWKSLHAGSLLAQDAVARGFTASLFELASATPWLTTRLARLRAEVAREQPLSSRRHPLAYVAALFVPSLAPRARGGITRVLFALLWVLVLACLGNSAYQWLARHGVLAAIESKFENTVMNFSRAPAVIATPSAREAPATMDTKGDAYARLDQDLRQLGELALARQRKVGGNPCEIGDIAMLRLNFRAERYAFSCDEPLVYTVIDTGEFVPGEPSHLRAYNWKEKRLVPAPASAPPVAPAPSAGRAK
jgi:Zn-dependent protease with chaperone function